MNRLRNFFAPNRVATYLMAISGAAAAVAVPLQGLDTTSTAGIVSGLVAIAIAFVTWMRGWQKHEASERGDLNGGVPPLPPADEAQPQAQSEVA